MNAHELPQPLLQIARRLTDGTVSARHHAASRARIFDRCAALTRTKPPSGTVIGLVCAGLLAAGLTGTAFVTAHRPARASAATVTPQATPLQATEEIEVSPPEARIYWDDRPLEGNPSTVSGPPDGKRHVVRAEAPGYASESETTKLVGNGSMSFSLQPIPLELKFVSATGPVPDAEDAIQRLREPLRACLEVDAPGDKPLPGTATVILLVSGRGLVTSLSPRDVHGFSTRGLACLENFATNAVFSTGGKPQTVAVFVEFRGSSKKATK